MDWAALAFGFHRLEENPELKLSSPQAGKLVLLMETLKNTVQSSNSVKTALNQSLNEAQLNYLQELAAKDELNPEKFSAELLNRNPKTALIDLVEAKLAPKAKGLSFQAPKSRSNAKEINVLSDLLVGLLFLEASPRLRLSPQQAKNVCSLLEKIRPQIAREYQLARKMENILTTGQKQYLYSIQEDLIKATDELPSTPLPGKDNWETQAEPPLINQTLNFLKQKS